MPQHCGVSRTQSPATFLTAIIGSFGGTCGTLLIVGAEHETSEDVRLSAVSNERRRERVKRAREIAMKGLRAAEASRARAVNEEARLGINWDDWEDDVP
jgi:hypothetical protein